MLRFLADENFNNQIVRGILRRKSEFCQISKIVVLSQYIDRL